MTTARLSILSLLAALAILALAVSSPEGFGAHAGGADAFSIDMDPSSEPANSATSLGSSEGCARIALNGVQDADEDGVDALDVDVTATQVPATNPMAAFSYQLNYDDTALAVQTADSEFLLGSVLQIGPQNEQSG